jgi:hypothetical protein
MIDLIGIKETDTIWTEFSGWSHNGAFAHIKGGEVVAIGDDGTIAFRCQNGAIETFRDWGVHSIHETEAQAWDAAARRLARIGAEVNAKAAECRAKAEVEVAA